MNRNLLVSVSSLCLCLFTRYDISAGPSDPKWGTAGGKIQWLSMERHYNPGKSSNSQSLALTLWYNSPIWNHLSLHGQVIHAEELRESTEGAADTLHNGQFSVVNHANLKYKMDAWGLDQSELILGRSSTIFDLMPGKNIRQKIPAIEGLVFRSNEIKRLTAKFGHIKKFSSFSSRDKTASGSPLSHDFLPTSDILRVNYDARGTQFFTATYTGVKNLELTLYDLYNRDIFNGSGVKARYTLTDRSNTKWKLNAHCLFENDRGKYHELVGELNSRACEYATQLTLGKLSIEPGYFKVSGDGLLLPFSSSFTLSSPFTKPTAADTDSIYLRGSYKSSRSSFSLLSSYTEHEGITRKGAKDWEIEMTYKYLFNKRAYFKLKALFANQNNKYSKDLTKAEWLFYLGYLF